MRFHFLFSCFHLPHTNNAHARVVFRFGNGKNERKKLNARGWHQARSSRAWAPGSTGNVFFIIVTCITRDGNRNGTCQGHKMLFIAALKEATAAKSARSVSKDASGLIIMERRDLKASFFFKLVYLFIFRDPYVNVTSLHIRIFTSEI